MSNEEEHTLTMCWFGFLQRWATSIIHVPEQEISPKEIGQGDLIFIWDKFMKSDLLTDFLGTPVPWSPALIENYTRQWVEYDDGSLFPVLIQKSKGKCLGAVLLISRLSESDLKPLIDDYETRGYILKNTEVLIGDITRDIPAFLPIVIE
jgi:hypothetical protein